MEKNLLTFKENFTGVSFLFTVLESMDAALDRLSWEQSLRLGSLGKGFLGKSSQEEGSKGSRLGQISQGRGLSWRQR